ncbi:MAG: cation diffusion facilitator family transporter [Deltaproteobacteria bacterium]|nr:cation diffusion facilitator family transporter [Deltaproteobacteria bacterium]
MDRHGVDMDASIAGRLKAAVALTVAVFVAEFVGGILTNSLALVSDSMHVLMDAVALALSLFALYISSSKPTERRTYGLHRAEVLVSLINGVTLLVISAIILYKAYFRFLNPTEVKSGAVLIVAAVGLIVNLTVAFRLHHFAKSDLNVKSAFLHVVGDALASIGVIAGAVIMYFTSYYVVDPVISVLIALVIIYGALRVITEAGHILLEGVPRDIDVDSVLKEILSIEGVTGVHSLHVWSICHNVNALSAHIDIEKWDKVERRGMLSAINEKLAERFHIFYTTIQMDCASCGDNSVFRRMTHRHRE